MLNHSPLVQVKAVEKPDRDVFVFFARQPIRKAVLFIHGYGGEAIFTWSHFPELLPASKTCAGRDVFFYGYDGLRAELNASACLFRDFLDRLLTKPARIANDHLPPLFQRSSDFVYNDLTIVAHSLGAVIARRALLDATKAKLAWASKTKLILFAPAHGGANVVSLALECLSELKVARHLARLARFESPLIDQLRQGSPTLKKLLSDTTQMCQANANPHLIARKVLLAEYEQIVVNDSFADDPPSHTIPGTTHTSVCKPRKDFRGPLQHVEDCL
jgi:alpha-beta hydrolase superfamily lysophospholipase